jgi:protein-S-isoprenylcysteine O-methyltransferase Ste14
MPRICPQVYEKKAPQLRRNLTILTVIVFMLTSVCTGLGAFDQPQWIPVTMGLSAAVGAVMAYTQVSTRMQIWGARASAIRPATNLTPDTTLFR